MPVSCWRKFFYSLPIKLVDFSKAVDVVRHFVLLPKISNLTDRPTFAIGLLASLLAVRFSGLQNNRWCTFQPPTHYFQYSSVSHLLTPRRPLHQTLLEIGHGFELPSCDYKLHTQSFLNNKWQQYQWPRMTMKVTFAYWKFWNLSNSHNSGNTARIIYDMFIHLYWKPFQMRVVPRDAMLAPYMLSSCVRLSVRLSHAGIVSLSKRLNVQSRKQRHMMAQDSSFLTLKI